MQSKTLSLIVALGVLVPAGIAAADATFPVDVYGAYLHVDSADQAHGATVIGLAALGMVPGETIRLTAMGDWNNGPGGDVYTTMMGVLSSSAILLSPSLINRVPGAIDAGTDVATPYTWPNGESMDIPEDFGFDASGTEIVIPPGAAYLFVSVRDNHLGDNSDPDGDCAVRLTMVSTTDVSPSPASLGLSASPNPFGSGTTIHFDLPRGGPVRLTVHDVTGRKLRSLFAGEMAGGAHVVRWDGRDDAGRRLEAGSYFVRVDDGARPHSMRVSLLR